MTNAPLFRWVDGFHPTAMRVGVTKLYFDNHGGVLFSHDEIELPTFAPMVSRECA